MKGHVPLWAVLPALKNREIAKGYLRDGHKWLGRPLNEREKAYLRDVIEQGDRVEKWLRELGYYNLGPRGKLFRLTGDIAESDEEAEEMLKKLDE
ncbi:hypothetical protein J7L70_08100 [Candidatus Bathyarchaeota archaeon]|nr:hypothetical protein [Candidatus Bathyarchaeota archaeon]